MTDEQVREGLVVVAVLVGLFFVALISSTFFSFPQVTVN